MSHRLAQLTGPEGLQERAAGVGVHARGVAPQSVDAEALHGPKHRTGSGRIRVARPICPLMDAGPGTARPRHPDQPVTDRRMSDKPRPRGTRPDEPRKAARGSAR
ncbi:hypothetical protein GCM10010106_20990 [Thermopolyspora flexuosa]|nr:hypothetical protein GCM10010106_20990 [Thermopolyspora flexuosa]